MHSFEANIESKIPFLREMRDVINKDKQVFYMNKRISSGVFVLIYATEARCFGDEKMGTVNGKT